MQKIFLAFPGYQVTLKQKVKRVGDFEFWNLEKITDDEFISLIQKKIKPFNKNVRRNYFSVNTEQDFRELAPQKQSYGRLKKALGFLLAFTILGTIIIALFYTGHHFQLF